MTNDHTVPQMYPHRFAAEKPGNKHPATVARNIDRPDKPSDANIRNVTAGRDFPAATCAAADGAFGRRGGLYPSHHQSSIVDYR